MAKHKTDPDQGLTCSLGEAIPGHYAGCAAIGVTGQPGDWRYYLEDSDCCDCDAPKES